MITILTTVGENANEAHSPLEQIFPMRTAHNAAITVRTSEFFFFNEMVNKLARFLCDAREHSWIENGHELRTDEGSRAAETYRSKMLRLPKPAALRRKGINPGQG
jgi:hypothetical protein